MVERCNGKTAAWALQQEEKEEGKERKEIWEEREKRKEIEPCFIRVIVCIK